MSFQPSFQPRGFDFLKDVDVRLSVELGRTSMTLREVLALGEESVVMLDRLTDELLDVMVNGKIIAKGEIVAQGNRFGLRIVELAGGDTAPTPATNPGLEHAAFDSAGLTDSLDDIAPNRAGKGKA
jgi:flagellar motor switch protein FliN/FliY